MADRCAPAAPPTAHAGHDPLLVAAFAADDVEAAERTLAEALLASCAECTVLAEDLRAIARATAELPAAVRPRDFTLRPEDAARLRPLGWRRLAAAFGARRLELTRPLAAGLTTIGLAGLLVSGLPLLSFGSSAGAAASSAPAAAAAAPSPGGAASGRSGDVQVAASPGVEASLAATSAAVLTPVGGPSAPGEAAGPVPTTKAAPPDRGVGPRLAFDADGAAPPVLLLASLVMLAAGLGLFVLSARIRAGR